jgi:hypothetical protein
MTSNWIILMLVNVVVTVRWRTTIKTFLFPPFLPEFQNFISIFFKFPLWSLLDEEQQWKHSSFLHFYQSFRWLQFYFNNLNMTKIIKISVQKITIRYSSVWNIQRKFVFQMKKKYIMWLMGAIFYQKVSVKTQLYIIILQRCEIFSLVIFQNYPTFKNI